MPPAPEGTYAHEGGEFVAPPLAGAEFPGGDEFHNVEAPLPTAGVLTSQNQSKLASKPVVLIPLCRKGDRAGIERQLQAGASVNETDMEGNTPLHVAVEAPKNEIATVQCLLENGANPNAVNFIAAAPLHYVCLRSSNFRGVANILLENGAMIDLQTLAGRSALHFAAENLQPELVEVLCLFNANTNLLDTEGNSTVHLALARENGRDTVKRQIVEYIMQYGGNFDTPNLKGLTPTHLACRTGAIRTLQLLLDQRADISVLTSKGQSALHLACSGGHAEVVQLLLAMSPGTLDMVDVEGNTALHICAVGGHLDCALLLLKMEANTSVKNNQKKTAFDVSKIRGTDLNSTHNPELVQVLKDARKGGTCRQS
eukprot:TRINITY_DN2121_c0_g2_i1.p1 TRINITY_DN2121_c0_g2~~TRINITY_DN2121_c0_g2_i1.p1  ORF type:complete len:402 (-),score=83.73 TRINITY_DN2121_c0_g2_i1:105-1214(-)